MTLAPMEMATTVIEGKSGKEAEKDAIELLVRNLSQASMDEAAAVFAGMKTQAATFRANGDEEEAARLEALLGGLVQMKARTEAERQSKLLRSNEVSMDGPVESSEIADPEPVEVDYNCDRWKQEWEALRVANSTPREIWEQMTQRMATMEQAHEKKLATLRHVSKDWMEKVKADVSRTEEEHQKRLSSVQRVAKQWEADANSQVQQLQLELQEAQSAQKVAEAAAATLQARVQMMEKGEGLESMRAEMSALEAKLEEVATENVHMEIAAEQFKQAAATQLQVESVAKQAELTQKDEEMKVIQADAEELGLQKTAYHGLCSELQMKVDHLESELGSCKVAVEAMNNKFQDEVQAAVDEELAAANEKIRELESKLASQNSC